jgi:hypothetical protein
LRVAGHADIQGNIEEESTTSQPQRLPIWTYGRRSSGVRLVASI